MSATFLFQADLALDVFSLTSFLFFVLRLQSSLCPMQAFFILFSSFLLCSLQEALGGHEHRTSPMFLHTRDYIKYSTESFKEYYIFKTNNSATMCLLTCTPP
ncbi:hypothetical protein E4T39_03048 [Aureobasidium subglaciale]|nr:hypothetical protein E4T39_03048 [Aureobasidium subglaciale]